jgi:two-component system nitrogen regulation response regulator GlnG
MTNSEVDRVLIADDEESIRFVLRETLEEEGCEVTDVDNGSDALDALTTGDFQLAFLDIRMPGPSGIELLDRVREAQLQVAIVIMTAQNTFENAVEAMRHGALEYLVKPFAIAEVKALRNKAMQTRLLQQEVRELRREVARQTVLGDRIIGKSTAMLDVFKTVGRISGRDVSVLITGESGTGKELIAQSIHAASPRNTEAFVPINMAAIPRDLLESELFGHERGAFTGAVARRVGHFRGASGGTLFLDEIGDIPVALQAKLLRVLQEQEVTPVGADRAEPVDVRIIAATHQDLDALVADGKFREDLLYRLRVMPLHLPALRERREDVPVLAEYFIARYADELAEGARYLTASTVEFLSECDWLGNVRELENAVKRALVLSTGEVLTVEDFAFLVNAPSVIENANDSLPKLVGQLASQALANPDANDVYRTVLDRVEGPLLEAVLAHTGGNQVRAAALLGMNRNTLRKKIAELDISLPGRV